MLLLTVHAFCRRRSPGSSTDHHRLHGNLTRYPWCAERVTCVKEGPDHMDHTYAEELCHDIEIAILFVKGNKHLSG